MNGAQLLRGALVAALFAAAAGCGGDASNGGAAASPLATLPPFELRNAVASARATRAPHQAPPPEPLTDEQRAELAGLAHLAASDAALLEVAREDVLRLGAGAALPLAVLVRDASLSDVERAAALDLIDPAQPSGSAALVALVTDGDPAWVRARAAWRLAEKGPDAHLAELVLRLKYEKDHETVVWIAAALARHENLAGVDGLIAIAGNPTSSARASAAHQLALLCERYHVADANELWRAWRLPAEERGVALPERSPELQDAIFGWIARLGEFQLRAVDDARFLLERMDVEAVRALAEALHDQDVYVRVHAAQCLQRMGPRALGAGPELLSALAEPELAPHAAVALGRVGYAPAEPMLVALLAPSAPLALRLASARGLGFFPSLTPEEARAALRPLLGAEPLELAQAAAESLAMRDPDAEDAAALLANYLVDARVDPASSERALRAWLADRDATAEVARWDELAPPAGAAETAEESGARRAARAALVREYLAR